MSVSRRRTIISHLCVCLKEPNKTVKVPSIFHDQIIKVPKNYTDGDHIDRFHIAIGNVFVVAQIFGLMPVQHIRSKNVCQIKFRWASVPTIVTTLALIVSAAIGSFHLRNALRSGIDAENIVHPIFYFGVAASLLNFLCLGKKWPEIMVYWTKEEEKFLSEPYGRGGNRLTKSIPLTASFVLLGAILEHIMFLASSGYNIYQNVVICNITVDNWYHYYFKSQFGAIYKFIPYHPSTPLIIEYFNISLTFGWNYMDLFIMLVSIGLATRFHQFNQRLAAFNGKICAERVWEELRLDYVSLCELVEHVDDHLAAIILLSCTNNLYFICFQLLNIFNSLPYTINKIYFWYSLLYLILRSMYVYLTAASINDAAKKPIAILLSIPTEGWCNELERFLTQVRTETVALSGCNFFYMTRKLLFGMAGTIVTYELVLLQMDNAASKLLAVNNQTVHVCGS